MKKIRDIVGVIIIATVVIFIYTFLHEAGHALVAIHYGETISEFNFGLKGHVTFFTSNMSDIDISIMKIAGLIFPLLIMYLTMIIYNKKITSKIYQLFYSMFCITTTSSMLSLVIVPILFKMYRLTPGDDVVDFLYKSKLEPLYVSWFSLGVFIFNIILLVKRGIFMNLVKIREGN